MSFKIYNKCLMISLFMITINLYSQTDKELLDQKLRINDLDIINELKNRGLLSEMDSRLLGLYVVNILEQGIEFDSISYGQLIDSVRVYKQKFNNEITDKINYGSDSIYVRIPNGDKVFMGMGTMSIEKLVIRESNNLPKKYKNRSLNKIYSTPDEISKIIADLNMTTNMAVMFGTTFIIKSETEDNLTKYRIGDFVEIASRILNSEEMKPFFEKVD